MKLGAAELDLAALERVIALGGRRHTNNKGYAQIREGRTREQVKRIARRILGPKHPNP